MSPKQSTHALLTAAKDDFTRKELSPCSGFRNGFNIKDENIV